jgi:hypothetical protein
VRPTVTVAGTGTTALLIKSVWARHLLYRGQHLTASAVYGRELFASQNVGGYAAACLVFPLIGLVMGLFGGAIAEGLASRRLDAKPAISASGLRRPSPQGQ